MKRIIECSLIFIFACNFCPAQQAVSAAGGDASGTGGTVSYTIGQVSYTSVTGSEGTVLQGIQQPYEISVISGLEDRYAISLDISVYPNPTRGDLTLKIANFNTGDLSYQLYDLNGTLLENKILVGKETIIVMSNYDSAVYFLKVTDNKKEVKTFKIVKN